MGLCRACAPVRCAHPSFWAHCHAKQGTARPPPIKASLLFLRIPKIKIIYLAARVKSFFSFNSTTEAREYSECQAFYPVVRIGSPTPSTARECDSPPRWILGGRHTHIRMRGWGRTNSDDGAYTLVLPPLTSQLRSSFRRTINIKKPQKITVWGLSCNINDM